MTTPSRSSVHTAEIIDTYHRMLPATKVRRRYLTLADGVRIHVVEAGDGPPVVFLHGMNTSSLSWVPLLEHLRQTRMIAVDRPGRGLSDPWPATRRADRRAAAVEFVDQVLTGLELERPVLVGQSGGGIEALWHVLARPERVSGVVLLGATPLLPGSRTPAPLKIAATPVVGYLMSRLMKPTTKALVRLLSSVGEGDTIVNYPELLGALVSGGRDPVAAAADRAELRSVVTPFGYRRSMRISADELRAVSVPVLLVWGDHDPSGPVAVATSAARLIPDARVEVLPAGHVPQFGQPDRVATLVSRFARQVVRHGPLTT